MATWFDVCFVEVVWAISVARLRKAFAGFVGGLAGGCGMSAQFPANADDVLP